MDINYFLKDTGWRIEKSDGEMFLSTDFRNGNCSFILPENLTGTEFIESLKASYFNFDIEKKAEEVFQSAIDDNKISFFNRVFHEKDIQLFIRTDLMCLRESLYDLINHIESKLN